MCWNPRGEIGMVVCMLAKLVLLLAISVGSVLAEEKWPVAEYEEVRAFLFDYTKETNRTVVADGKLHAGVANPEGAKLDKTQTARLLKALRGGPGGGMKYYRPWNGFVFFDKKGKPVAHVTLCLVSKMGVAIPGGPSSGEWDFEEMRKLLQELKVP